MMSSRILRSQPPSRCWARWMRREQPQSRGLRSIQDSPSTAFVMPPMHGSTIRPTLPRAIEGMRLAGVPEGVMSVMSAIGHSRHFLIRTSDVCFSNRPFEVKHFQTIRHCSVDVASRARASLRNRHQGPSIMGVEDEVEQSYPRPCRQFERQVQADERTHLIHRPPAIYR